MSNRHEASSECALCGWIPYKRFESMLILIAPSPGTHGHELVVTSGHRLNTTALRGHKTEFTLKLGVTFLALLGANVK